MSTEVKVNPAIGQTDRAELDHRRHPILCINCGAGPFIIWAGSFIF